MRAASVAAGGSKRLGKLVTGVVEMGKGGGKEGSNGKAKSKSKNSMYPPNSHWKDFNPDPSVIQNPQRIRWHPANKPQLKSLAADES